MTGKKDYEKIGLRHDCLMPKHSKPKIYTIYGFDTETHGYMNKFVVGGLYTDKYISFVNKAEMQQHMTEISSKKDYKDTYIVATNLDFDYQCLYYDSHDWNDFEILMRGGRIIVASREKTKFIDTMNYTIQSVEKLGQAIGIHKIHFKKHLGKVPRTREQWRKLKEYNARDCLISKRWLELFQQRLNVLGGELKPTIASCALDLYQRKYIPFPIFKEQVKTFKDKEKVKDFIYKGYYGGRVETFVRGKLIEKTKIRNDYFKDKLYFWMDYNSAYPYQMLKEYPLPVSAKIAEQSSIEIIKKYHGTSQVTVNIPYTKYPLLPYRQNGKLIFPYGTWTAVYNHIELRRAIEIYGQDCIIKVHKTVYYTKTFKPFEKYILELYKLRMEYKDKGDMIMVDVCKLLMNSLYGKLASRNLQDIEFFDLTKMTNEEILRDDKKGRFDDMQVTDNKGNQITKGYKTNNRECEQNYVLPILSSCVTSYQRVDLHKDIVRLNALYCDTDSILTETPCKDSYELGGLKLEKKVIKGFLIRPKCYMIYDATLKKDTKEMKGWNTKVKGINRMTSERFYSVLTNTPINQVKFMKIKESMKRGYMPNQKHKFEKLQGIEDDKRIWERPFDKDELQESSPVFINE